MGDLSASNSSWNKILISTKWLLKVKDPLDTETPEDLIIHENPTYDPKIKGESDDGDQQNFLEIDTLSAHTASDSENSIRSPQRLRKKKNPKCKSVDLNTDECPSKRKQRRNSITKAKRETPEERAERLAKMSAYAARRLAKETPEQRSARLRRMSEYTAKRLSQESPEDRARRLSRMSAYAAQRLANETPEQRKVRLLRMSAYAAKRQAIRK